MYSRTVKVATLFRTAGAEMLRVFAVVYECRVIPRKLYLCSPSEADKRWRSVSALYGSGV